MKEYKLVIRKIDEIKPDPNQPRKEFDQEKIENMAGSIKSQGIINPIEIDENNIIITGEMRWRAGKETGLKEIECKLFEGMDKWDRLERQTIENLHHNLFTSEEKEKVITQLWESGRYETQEVLGKKIGLNQVSISMYTIAGKVRNKKKPDFGISSGSLYQISRLPESYQKDVITKLERGEIRPSEVQAFVSSIKNMPSDIKTEILKSGSELTLEEAIDISQVQDPEMRQESINFIKKQKRDQERTKDYIIDIAKGEEEPYEVIIDIDQKIIDQFLDIKKKIFIKMRKKNVESYNEHVQVKLKRVMKEILQFLQEQLQIGSEIIEIQTDKGRY